MLLHRKREPNLGLWIASRARENALPLVLILLGATWGMLLARLPLPNAVVWTGLGLLALGSLLEPMVGIVGGLLVGLLRAYLQTEVPAVPAQLGHVFVALGAAVWLAQGLAQRNLRLPLPPARAESEGGRSAAAPVLLALLGFVGVGWLSLWSAVGLAAYGLPELVKWLEILLVLVLIAARARPPHLPWLVGAVLLIGVFQAAVGLVQFGLRAEGPEHFLIPGTEFYRAYGTFEQPNPYAGYVGMTLALALGATLGSHWDVQARRRGGRGSLSASLRPFALLPVVVVLGAALGASWSRGAWIGFAAALVAMAAALPRRATYGLALVGLLVVLVLALYATGLVPPSVLARLTDFAAGLRLEDVRGVGINNANYAVIERLAHWQAALEMWRSRFWVGVGLGCYEAAYPLFALINWPVALGHAHNIYLNLLAETGLLGLATYLVFWGTVLWQTWRIARRATGLSRGIAVGLLGTWTHLAVHNFFDNLYVNNVHLLVGLLLGVLVTCARSLPKDHEIQTAHN
jgi:putative inorganic carbon (HCO3(-)) transporter